jgi:predicted solute-binding protein
LRTLSRIAAASPLRGLLSEEELIAYWRGISFDFNEEHRRGFDLFRRYAMELGLL